jgi:hypothetical protein
LIDHEFLTLFQNKCLRDRSGVRELDAR